MLRDQGCEELNCLPRAAVPRSGLHRCADLLLLLLLFPLLLLQLSEAAACSPSWASSGRREPDLLFPVRAVPSGLEEGRRCPRPPRSEPRGSGTGSLWHRRSTRPPPPAFRRDYSSQKAERGRAGPGRAVLPRSMLGDVVLAASFRGRRCGRGGRGIGAAAGLHPVSSPRSTPDCYPHFKLVIKLVRER